MQRPGPLQGDLGSLDGTKRTPTQTVESWYLVAMGDKSPKSKDKNKKQDDAQKKRKKDDAAKKQAPSEKKK